MGFAVRFIRSLPPPPVCVRIALCALALAANGCAPKFNFRSSLDISDSAGQAYGPATQLVFTREPSTETAAGSEIPVQVTIEDSEGRVVSGGVDSTAQITLNLSSGSGPLNGTLTLNASSGVAEFVYQGVNIATLGSGDVITATKADMSGSGGVGTLSGASASFEVISNNSWLGSQPTAEWLATGGVPAAGQGDGMFNVPSGTFVDGSGNLYVTDYRSSRVMWFNSSGTYEGWVGMVEAAPTGGATNCTTTHTGKFTPGWCTGGFGESLDPIGIWGDGTYLYVTGVYGGLYRFDASTGVYMGWTGLYTGGSGTMSDTYTTGCNALNGSVTPAVTPGWCVGGESNIGNSSSVNGAFASPSGLIGDGTYLYVADSSSKVQRINASTGAGAGWIGNLGAAGGGGCTVSVGSFTSDGWCTDATATPQSSSAGDGSLSSDGVNAMGIYLLSGSLYVTDSANKKISQYTASSGAFVGWIGMVATEPTGGAADCTSTSAGNPTPGWCTGGKAEGTSTIDGLRDPSGITGDGLYLYVMDDGDNRIVKYDISNGTYEGWIGRVDAAGSGGCGSSGDFTSGWCTVSGTTAESGHGDGMLSAPLMGLPDASSSQPCLLGDCLGTVGIFYASGDLWVADTGNNRVSQYNASSGDFNGWIGADASAAVGWQTTGLSAGAYDDNSLGQMVAGAYTDGTNLYVGDNYRIKSYTLGDNNPSYVGWTGEVLDTPTGGTSGCSSTAMGSVTPGWCSGGDAEDDEDQYGNGGLVGESWVGVDVTSDGTYIYAMDGQGRISRYDLTGAFEGWIGLIGTSPTGGDPGCAEASVGTVTPGWCTGGSPEWTTTVGGGFSQNTHAIYADGTYLYVGDNSAGRVQKILASTGQYIGWIGKVRTSPTGGASGCAGAVVGSITPGWCIGGSGDGTGNANGDGSLPTYVVSVTGDGTYLYVVTSNQLTINRYNASTGAFAGWIGSIGTSPTGGDPGCAEASANSFTPGWCTGGTATLISSGVGTIYEPSGLYTDGFYLYATDGGFSNIYKFVLGSGAFVGWKGAIKSSPTGGDSGCTSATKGTFTPGWCTGGGASTDYSYYDVTGAFNSAAQITGAGSFLYIVDPADFRIDRIGK